GPAQGKPVRRSRAADESMAASSPPGKKVGPPPKAKPENRLASDSDRGNAIDLHVERTVPGRHADEAARRRARGEIPRIDGIDRLEMRRVRAIHGALDDLV